jgi:hypothetical protein
MRTAILRPLRRPATAEDLAAYVYAVLGGQSYTRRFWNELETPGHRVPLTRSGALFDKAAALGRKLIWLHTYAERFRGEDRGDEVPAGAAKIVKGVSDKREKYPETFSYDESAREIIVGDGRLGPVEPQVWDFEVSGLKVVQSWLGYRMKKRAGKKSSPLDYIRPERWTPRMSEELLELLWGLEATLAMEPELEAVLDEIVAAPCFTAAQLPSPTPEERKAPGAASAAGRPARSDGNRGGRGIGGCGGRVSVRTSAAAFCRCALNHVVQNKIWSGRRDSNPRPQPWQGCALPLSYARPLRTTTVSPSRRSICNMARGIASGFFAALAKLFRSPSPGLRRRREEARRPA